MEKPTPKANSSDSHPQDSVKPPSVISVNKPPLALIYDAQKIERAYWHSDLEGIYRLKIGKRKGLEIWIVDGAKIRRELYTDFLFGGNDQRYKFVPKGEIWIDNTISVEELEFTILHEIIERELMIKGMSYAKAHELATQEELRARINKTESIDDLRTRWYKTWESKAQESRPQEAKVAGVHEPEKEKIKEPEKERIKEPEKEKAKEPEKEKIKQGPPADNVK